VGIALKSRQVKIDLIYACVQDLMFLSRGDRDDGDAFQTHPVSQASARGEANDSDILLGRNRYLLEPTEWPPGSQASCGVGERTPDCSPGHTGKKALSSQ